MRWLSLVLAAAVSIATSTYAVPADAGCRVRYRAEFSEPRWVKTPLGPISVRDGVMEAERARFRWRDTRRRALRRGRMVHGTLDIDTQVQPSCRGSASHCAPIITMPAGSRIEVRFYARSALTFTPPTRQTIAGFVFEAGEPIAIQEGLEEVSFTGTVVAIADPAPRMEGFTAEHDTDDWPGSESTVTVRRLAASGSQRMSPA